MGLPTRQRSTSLTAFLGFTPAPCPVFISLLFAYSAQSNPIPASTDTANPPPTPSNIFHVPNDNSVVLHITEEGQKGLLWSSIGLAVFVALIQSLVATMAAVAEDSRAWTFRFRLALYEHWWWTYISVLLSISLVFIILSFLAGNDGEALSILVLSSAMAMSVVRYAVPAWRAKDYIKNRWLAWTGPSRTGIDETKALFCGSAEQWKKIESFVRQSRQVKIKRVESDNWGWTLVRPQGIAPDPTELLAGLDVGACTDIDKFKIAGSREEAVGLGTPCVYNDGLPHISSVSLLWGVDQGFRRRVSRGVTSMPITLLLAKPLTMDGYAGEGLCLAMGVLGRNKGLAPYTLEFNMDGIPGSKAPKLTKVLEDTSVWSPRPQKVLRSYYHTVMEPQYKALGKAFVAAAVELALILADCPGSWIRTWLECRLEQQDLALNLLMQQQPDVKDADLNAAYRASYTSMVVSLNYLNHIDYHQSTGTRHHTHVPGGEGGERLLRPDLICAALLLFKETQNAPVWWTSNWAVERVRLEAASLRRNWKDATARLLGLERYPDELTLPRADDVQI